MIKKRRLESIRTKTTLIIGMLFICLIIAISFILNLVMLNKISVLENQHVKEQVDRAHKSIDTEISDLSETTFDWGQWDDSCQFVHKVNRVFIENNLTKESLNNIRADFIVFLNESGKYVYSCEVDAKTNGIVPLSDEIKSCLDKSALIKNRNKYYEGKGLLLIEQGISLVASCPIRSSNATGPVRGRLILGRFLDEEVLCLMSSRANLELAINRLDKMNSEESHVFKSMNYNSSILVKNYNKDLVGGYLIRKDINDNPVIGLSIKTDRDIDKIGQTGVRYTLFSLSIASFIFTLLIILFLDKSVLSRLLALSREIRLIGDEEVASFYLKPEKKKDEITIVTEEINNMLYKLEDSRHQIMESKEQLKQVNDNLETEVINRTIELYKTNKNLQEEIEERVKTQEEVQQIAYYDALTSLPNRLFFMERLNQILSITNTDECVLAIMFLDLDSFKMINDSWGHSTGDQLLKKVAKRLVGVLRKSDLIARIGGDEFVVMIEIAENEDIYKVNLIAEKILECFKTPFLVDIQECFITTSIGVAMFPIDGLDADTLIKNADIAMYSAKKKGKNQCVFCNRGMKNIVSETMKLTNNLYRALERNEFELYYQPQVNYLTGKTVGLEALIRWNHPELGMVSPSEFIPIAEQTGLIIPIGEWVLNTACRENKKWQDAGLPKIRVAVNLSVHQFQCENIVEQVEAALKRTGLKGQYLELEITESVVMNEVEYVVNILSDLKKLGISLSIDDFGTEFSSLQYLKQLPVDRIKIPMPFTHGIGVNTKDEAIIKAFIVLAKNMGLGIVSEGVETKEQLAFLTKRKCDEIQGYYFYKPMPAKEVEALLKSNA